MGLPFFSKWLTFSASCLVLLSAGLAYTYAVYSDALKVRFRLSQTELAGIGTACNVGGYLALPAGLVYDSLRNFNRLGPFLTTLVGVLLHTGGYLAIWWTATHQLSPPFWLLLLFAVVACNGQTWFETAALVTCVKNFETERGTVIGILKAMLGLSASVYTAIYVAFLDPHSLRFLLLLALMPSLLALVCGLFLNRVPFIQAEPHTKSHAFHLALTAIIGLAMYQGVIAFARSAGHLDIWSGVLMVAAIAILLLPVLAIPFIFGGIRARKLKHRLAPDLVKAAEDGGLSTDMEQPLLGQQLGITADTFRDKTPLRCLRSVSFWILVFLHAVGSGAGLTFLNNLGEEVLALDTEGSSRSQAVYVSTFSIANCLGRLASGFVPDALMRARSLPRTASCVLLSGLTLAAAGLAALQRSELLAATALLAGFAFGGFQGITPAITSEIFGLRNFATNYALVQLGPAVGSYVLATWLAGFMYDREAAKFPHGACRGPACFRTTFLVVAAASAVALLLSLLLHRRTLPLYERVIRDTLAERKRRGREGEIAEERFMMRRTREENSFLRSFVVRFRAHASDLQGMQLDLRPDRAQRIVSDMNGLSSQADTLMSSHDRLWQAYSSLPSTPR